jgi:hypothetical protein
MKKLLIVSAFLAIGMISAKTSTAQVRVGVNINIGDQPRWRPAGYDYAEYYYLPDIETYYYVPRHQFVYLSNGRWVFSASLPSRYSGYDLYGGRKIVINRPNAYYYHDNYRRQYPSRNYYDSYERHDNGNHNGWYKNKKGGRRH